MAIRAVMCGECLGTSLHAGRIVDGGGGAILGMAIDRRRANLDQRPTDDCRVLDGTGDTIKAAEEEYRRADAENYRKRADYRKDTHIRLRCARLLTTRGKQYVAQYAVCVTFILSNSLDGVAVPISEHL
jgi:hypothetical protein